MFWVVVVAEEEAVVQDSMTGHHLSEACALLNNTVTVHHLITTHIY